MLNICLNIVLLRSEAQLTNSTESSPCLLPKAAGNCRAHISSYYFDQTSGLCSDFIFTGCNGNANNFLSLEDCQQMCREHILRPVKAVADPAIGKQNSSFSVETEIISICKFSHAQ